MSLKIAEVKAKSILNKSRISDFTLNCYVGCQHACNYCYARYMSYYSGHSEPWGTYIDVKVNAPEVLEKDVKRARRRGGGEVMMSSICDGWQPVEAKYGLSRRCLGILLENGFRVSVLTKSRLILRDFDILKRYKGQVDLGLTITTFNHKLQRTLEPFCSTALERLNVIKEANKAGIDVWVFMGPLIPGFTGSLENVNGLFEKLSKVGVGEIYVDSLHYYRANFRNLERSLGVAYPGRFKAFLSPVSYKKSAHGYDSGLKDIIDKASSVYGLKNIRMLC